MTPGKSEQYFNTYQESLQHPIDFWGTLAQQELEWFTPYTSVIESSGVDTRWFVDGEINITHNCLDRHVRDGEGDVVAYIYNNELGEEQKITYRELLSQVNAGVNTLLSLGVQRGDRVVLYMPLTIEMVVMMLACARMGAIHSVVYAGFSAEALAARIRDAGAKVVCTATSTQKNGKRHDLLSVVRQAVLECESVAHILVLRRSTEPSFTLVGNELDLADQLHTASDVFTAVPVESSTPLFILYTSGTTGTPKGIVHGHGGYSLFAHVTFKENFNIQPQQVHWTAADTGWITGHSYIVYAPLSNGVTSVLYEGSPLYPAPDRYWELVEKYKVQSFYTAPTVIRLLMREGESYPAKHDLSTLRVLGSVGEPINPVAWEWYAKHIGGSKAEVIDTWWQTENGGHMLVTPPGMLQKPGSAGLPFYGVTPAILDDDGNQITKPGVVGHLVIQEPWPGALMTCWNDPDRFAQYWSEFANTAAFYTGDVAQFDEDGYYTVLGRADDVINVAGVRVGTAEVESSLVAHDSVAEAAVIGLSDEIKGERIKAFVVLNNQYEFGPELERELKQWVRQKIGYVAEPAEIEVVSSLPKTRSGKIMRRILKARDLGIQVGDTSTMED